VPLAVSSALPSVAPFPRRAANPDSLECGRAHGGCRAGPAGLLRNSTWPALPGRRDRPLRWVPAAVRANNRSNSPTNRLDPRAANLLLLAGELVFDLESGTLWPGALPTDVRQIHGRWCPLSTPAAPNCSGGEESC